MLERHLGPDLRCPPGFDYQEWQDRLIGAGVKDFERRMAVAFDEAEVPPEPAFGADYAERQAWLNLLTDRVAEKFVEGLPKKKRKKRR